MPVSKRTRYEVLKRDNHTCRYCGATAPDAVLTVDHVTPVALGGSDKPGNLVAACKDCNAGKSSTTPSDALVAQVGEDDIRWADAIKRAAEKMSAESSAKKEMHTWFLDEWHRWNDDYSWLPDGWAKSLDYWLGAGLPKASMLECLDIAVQNRAISHRDVFKYMGGIARKKIETLHEEARALLETEAVNGS